MDDKDAKAVDIASTYVQVLITLSSGIIAAIIGFYPTLLSVKGFNFLILHGCLVLFALSIIAGLFSLGGLVNAVRNKTPPTGARGVRWPTIIQLFSFGIGISVLILSLPIPK